MARHLVRKPFSIYRPVVTHFESGDATPALLIPSCVRAIIGEKGDRRMAEKYGIQAMDGYPRSFKDEPNDPVVAYEVAQWEKLLDDFVELARTLIVPTMERVLGESTVSGSVRDDPTMPRVVLETPSASVYIAPVKGSVRIVNGGQSANRRLSDITENLIEGLTKSALDGTLPSHHPKKPKGRKR